MSDRVGQAAWLLQPIIDGIRDQVFAAEKVHADDTPVPVLEPGLGRTRTGRLWVYVRDDRPFCGPAPPAAVCRRQRDGADPLHRPARQAPRALSDEEREQMDAALPIDQQKP